MLRLDLEQRLDELPRIALRAGRLDTCRPAGVNPNQHRGIVPFPARMNKGPGGGGWQSGARLLDLDEVGQELAQLMGGDGSGSEQTGGAGAQVHHCGGNATGANAAVNNER